MFCLPLLRGIDNRLVQCLDGAFKSFDLFFQSGNHLAGCADVRLGVVDGVSQCLFLVVCLIQLNSAILLLVVIISLLLLQQSDHFVNHSNNLVKSPLGLRCFAAQCHHQEIQPNMVLRICLSPRRADCLQGASSHRCSAGGHLDKARTGTGTWQGLLEQVQGVVVVQDLNCVGQGNKLICPRLGSLLPFCCFRGTTLLQIRQELLVLCECRFSVGQIFFHLHNLHTEVSDLLGLRLDGCGESDYFFLLGVHEAIVGGNAFPLVCG